MWQQDQRQPATLVRPLHDMPADIVDDLGRDLALAMLTNAGECCCLMRTPAGRLLGGCCLARFGWLGVSGWVKRRLGFG